MATRAVGFVGAPGSGKTTLIVQLIGHFGVAGRRIGVIKHTHHAIEDPARGDTEQFLDAGAAAVVLCTDHEFVALARNADGQTIISRHGSFIQPDEILGVIDADLVLVEGFKQFAGWPRILVEREGSEPGLVDRTSVVAVVGDRVGANGVVHFDAADVAGITALVDRISR